MDIGSYIKFVRKSRGLSQEDLLDVCSVKTLSRTENGQTSPSIDLLEKLSKKLNVDLLKYKATLLENQSEIDQETRTHILMLNEEHNMKDLAKFTEPLRFNHHYASTSDFQFINLYYCRGAYFESFDQERILRLAKESFSYNMDDELDVTKIGTYYSLVEIDTILLMTFVYTSYYQYEECYDFLSPLKLKEIDLDAIGADKLSSILKINYNKMLSAHRTNRFDEVYDDMELTIRYGEKYKLFSSISSSYWLYARVMFEENKIEESHQYCRKFLSICKLQGIEHIYEKYLAEFNEKFGYKH